MAVIAAWAGAARADDAVPEGWKSLDGDGLVALAGQLADRGDGGKADRVLLIGHLQHEFFPDVAKTRSMGLARWEALADALAQDMADDSRSLWYARIRDAFAGSHELMGQLESGEIHGLVRTLAELGDAPDGLFVRWVNTTEAWKALDPEGLRGLAWNARQPGDANRAARQRLTEHLEKALLPSPEAIREVRCYTWFVYVQCLHQDWSKETKAFWATGLRSAFLGTPEALSAADVHDLRFLELAFGRLRESARSTESFAAEWAAGEENREKKLAGSELQWNDCWRAAWVWHVLRDKGKAQQWALRTYQLALGTEEAREAADVLTADRVCILLNQVGLVGQGRSYPALAATVARLAARGELERPQHEYLSWGWYRHYLWGRTLGTAETRATARSVLTGDSGAPRLGLAQVLTWAYKASGEHDAWKQFLAERSEDAGLAPDSRARWLVARAYAESATRREGAPLPLAGRKWLDQALVTATSESCRLDVLRELVAAYAAETHYDQAVGLINSLTGQFRATESAAVLDELRQRVEQDRTENAARRTRRNEARRRMTTQVVRQELLRRLAVAKKKGDRQEAARLRRLVEQRQ